jgi:hypothetical protein
VADGFAAGEPETVAASYKLIQRAGGRDATFESYRRIVQERGGK